MIPDSHKNTVYLADTLATYHPRLRQQIDDACRRHGVACRTITGTLDIWCRDYMPVQVAVGRFVQFHFRPAYLRGDEETITPVSATLAAVARKKCTLSDLVLDGGTVVHGTHVALVTNRLYDDNLQRKPALLRQQLGELLEVNRLIVIPEEPGDWTGHADGVVRFIDDRTVLVNDYSRVEPSYGRELLEILTKAGLEVVKLPYAPRDQRRRGSFPSAFGVYTNFLMVGKLLLVPIYRIMEDDRAVVVLGRGYPDCDIVPIDSRGVAAKGGVLNCISWTTCDRSQEHGEVAV